MRLSTYSVFTFIFILPGTAMYTIGAAAVVDKTNRTLYVILAVGLAASVFLLAFLFKKYKVDKEISNE